MTAPQITLVTPTRNRAAFLRPLWDCVQAQSEGNFEWRILDDSKAPDPWLSALSDARVHYEHITQPLSLGEKRNRLVEDARSDVIVHLDDDDFYAPHYVRTMRDALNARALDLLNLRGWFLFDLRHRFFGYWDLLQKEGLHYCCETDGVRPLVFSPQNNAALADSHLGYGFSFVYRKAVWRAQPFASVQWDEDGLFAKAALQRFACDGLKDGSGLCLHRVHADSSSRCFAQYHLPSFLMRRIFPQLP